MMGARPLWDERRAPDETTEIDELQRSGPAPDSHDPRRCHEPASCGGDSEELHKDRQAQRETTTHSTIPAQCAQQHRLWESKIWRRCSWQWCSPVAVKMREIGQAYVAVLRTSTAERKGPQSPLHFLLVREGLQGLIMAADVGPRQQDDEGLRHVSSAPRTENEHNVKVFRLPTKTSTCRDEQNPEQDLGQRTNDKWTTDPATEKEASASWRERHQGIRSSSGTKYPMKKRSHHRQHGRHLGSQHVMRNHSLQDGS